MRTINAAGMLFINQARLTSRTIHDRFDSDVRGVLLSKLDEAFTIANNSNLMIVFTGHLFERPKEHDARIMSGLIGLLARAKHKPICIASVSELKNDGQLADDIAMSVLAATQLITIVTSTGPVGVLLSDTGSVDLWATPFSQITDAERFEQNTLCITSGGGNANCAKIENVCQVVAGGAIDNGASNEQDGTHWLTPDSMSRLALSEKNITPTVWQWLPGNSVKSHTLKHEDIAFTTTNTSAPESISALPKSLFVELLKEELEDDLEIDDSVAFKADIEQLMSERDTSEPVRLIFLDLIKRAVA